MLGNYNAFHSASESSEQTPRDRMLDLPFCFRYKHKMFLINHLSLAQGESLADSFRANFWGCACFDLLVEEFPLSAVADRFELRCQLKQLLLLNYKMCPCW